MHIRKLRILEAAKEQEQENSTATVQPDLFSNTSIKEIIFGDIFIGFDELIFKLSNLEEVKNSPEIKDTPLLNWLFEEEENTNSENPNTINQHQQKNTTFAAYYHIISKLDKCQANLMFEKKYFLDALMELKEDYKDLIKIFLDFRNGKELNFNDKEKNYIQKQVFLDMLKQRKGECRANIDLASRSSRNEEIQISLKEWKNSAQIKLFLEAIATHNNEALDFDKIFSLSSYNNNNDEHSYERKLLLEAINLHKEFEEFVSNFNNINEMNASSKNFENSVQMNLCVIAFKKFKNAQEKSKNLDKISRNDCSISKTNETTSKRRLHMEASNVDVKLTKDFKKLMSYFIKWENSFRTELSWPKLEKHFAVLFDLSNIYTARNVEETCLQENEIFKQRKLFLDNLKKDKEEFAGFAKILLNEDDTYRFTPTAYKFYILKTWERIQNVFMYELANSMEKQSKLQNMTRKLEEGIQGETKTNELDDQPSTSKSAQNMRQLQFKIPESNPKLIAVKTNTSYLDEQPSTSKASKNINHLFLPTPDTCPEKTINQMKMLTISTATTKQAYKPEQVNNFNVNKRTIINTMPNCSTTVKTTRADIAKLETNEHGMVKIGPNGTMVAKSDLLNINWSQSELSVTRKILVHVFGKKTLRTHTLTGKASPAFLDCNKPKKKQLDPLKVADITHMMMKYTNITEKDVRFAITTKCADETKTKKKVNKKILKFKQGKK